MTTIYAACSFIFPAVLCHTITVCRFMSLYVIALSYLYVKILSYNMQPVTDSPACKKTAW